MAITSGDYFPIDFRIYDDKSDGKSKNDHFREMLVRAVDDKGIKTHAVLFDSWYASSGMTVKLEEHPCLVRLFRLVATNGDNEHLWYSG